MAVLEAVPGIEVTIKVDGEPLIEYATENDEVLHIDPKVVFHKKNITVTNYIEATTGKAFSVHLSVKEPYSLDAQCLSFRIHVDGVWMRGMIMNSNNYKNKAWERNVEGPVEVKDGVRYIMPFEFTEIALTSERIATAEVDKHKAIMERAGEILVNVYRARVTAGIPSKETGVQGLDLSTKFHQKAVVKKGQSHGTSLGTAINCHQFHDVFKTKFLDGADYPIAVFAFKYRSADALRSLRILERSPSPESDKPANMTQNAAPTIKLENFSQAQKDQLLENLLQGLAGVKSPIKVEHNLVVKREREDEGAGRARKKPKKMLGKVTVDLTEEDEPSVPAVELN